MREKHIKAWFVGVFLFSTTYLGMWFLSLGAHDPTAENWLHEVYILKHRLAQRITEEKVIVCAGSNALFGIDSELMAREVGRPVINLAGHAGLTFEFHIDQVLRVVKAGDVVVLPLEFQYYEQDYMLTEWQLQNMQSWGIKHLKEYGWREFVRYLAHPSLRSLSFRLVHRSVPERNDDELFTTFNSVIDHPLARDSNWSGYSYRSMNESGDFLVQAATTDLNDSGASFYSVPGKPSDRFVANAIALKNELDRRGARLFFAWPVTARDVLDPLSPKFRQPLERLRETLRAHNCKFIGDPADANFDKRFFFDTLYHLNADGAALRSVQLARSLRAELSPPLRLSDRSRSGVDQLRLSQGKPPERVP